MCREQEEEIAISSARSYAAKMDLLATAIRSLNHSKGLQTYIYSCDTGALTKKKGTKGHGFQPTPNKD